MSRLVVVSNRVADPNGGPQAGGLATAVGDALLDTGGVWFGWNGEVVDADTNLGMHLERSGNVTLATLPLTQGEYDGYYLGYANRTLWPVFHYRLDLAHFSGEDLKTYRQVNRRFAKALSALIDRDDIVWVHDYHLIPLAAELRQLGIENRTGFFLHIPFPPPEIVSAAPEHAQLFDTLFAYDVVGFQTEQDQQNFEHYIEQTAGEVSAISHPFRRARRAPLVGTFPIGIDADAFRALATSPEADDHIRRFSRGTVRNHIIGVDRLDYSKGLPDRFRAFCRFLERFPDSRKSTILVQIASPTREELTAYADIRSELEQLSGAINGQFGDFDWTPLRYIHRAVPRDVLAALFRGSRIGLVTPFRDGMNLVAKEYVAAQDPEDPGVLVLSHFAGAAADLKEALLVNPYDIDQMAAALNAAVTMSLEERRERHTHLLRRVRERNVVAWRQSFLEALRGGRDAS